MNEAAQMGVDTHPAFRRRQVDLENVILTQAIELDRLRHVEEQRDAIGTELRAAHGALRDKEELERILRQEIDLLRESSNEKAAEVTRLRGIAAILGDEAAGAALEAEYEATKRLHLEAEVSRWIDEDEAGEIAHGEREALMPDSPG